MAAKGSTKVASTKATSSVYLAINRGIKRIDESRQAILNECRKLEGGALAGGQATAARESLQTFAKGVENAGQSFESIKPFLNEKLALQSELLRGQRSADIAETAAQDANKVGAYKKE